MQYRRIELVPVGDEPKPKQYRAVLWSDDDVEEGTIEVVGSATPFEFASMAARHHKCDVQCVIRDEVDQVDQLPGVSRNGVGAVRVPVGQIGVDLPEGGTVAEFTIAVAQQPWKPSGALLQRRYSQLHAACPACGGVEMEMTCVGNFFHDMESARDMNRAGCQCGWRGVVHDLVPKKETGRA